MFYNKGQIVFFPGNLIDKTFSVLRSYTVTQYTYTNKRPMDSGEKGCSCKMGAHARWVLVEDGCS